PVEPEARGVDPGEVASLQEEELALFEALAGLSDHHREAFRLGVLEGQPYAQVAAQLGIPVGTVKSRVYHAVQKLRERLNPGAGPPLGGTT
ncbi:MAG TPA: RNA polymerase sigma factor, partial [Planctomycetota bacterium]|nr:RNA polymerase sigma factor [Planctomycetota bacterium]